MRIVALAVEAHPFDLHRQHVARGDAALRRLEKREPRPVVADVAERNRRNQRRLDRLGRSFRVPAGPRQMSGEHIALEHAALACQRDPGRVQRHHQRLELGHRPRHHRRGFVALLQFEPVEAVRRQRDHVGQFADHREARAAEHFQRNAALPGGEVELGRLRRSRQIGDAQNDLVLILAHIAQHRAVFRPDERHGAAAEGERGFADRDQPLGGREQRGETARLRLDIDGLIAIDRVHDGRRVKPRGIGAGEAAIAVRRPLHRRADAVAVAEIDIVAHPDLVAVIDDRRSRERQQQRVHQLDLAPVVVHQRRQPAADADIDAGAGIVGVGRPQIIALDVGDHFQRQLVVIAQEQRPLAAVRNVGRLAQDVGDRKAVLLRDRHVDARHQRKVIGHLAFVAAAEIFLHVLRPLIGFGQQHLALGVGVEFAAQPFDDGMRLRQVLVVGAVALAEIGNGVETEAVDAGVEPALHHLHQRAHHARIVEIEVRLVREEAVPVELAGFRIPGPVRLLGIGEDDPRALVFLVGVAPDIPVAGRGLRVAAAGALEPVVLVGGVVDDELGDDAQSALLGFLDEALEILHRPEIGVDVAVVGDVIAVVAARRGIERQQPQRGDAEILQVSQLFRQSGKIADAVIVAVGEGLDVKLIDNGVLVPELVDGFADLHFPGIDR